MTEGPSRLPAPKLVENCYYNMFQNCISLEIAPELDATELYDSYIANVDLQVTSAIIFAVIGFSLVTGVEFVGKAMSKRKAE